MRKILFSHFWITQLFFRDFLIFNFILNCCQQHHHWDEKSFRNYSSLNFLFLSPMFCDGECEMKTMTTSSVFLELWWRLKFHFSRSRFLLPPTSDFILYPICILTVVKSALALKSFFSSFFSFNFPISISIFLVFLLNYRSIIQMRAGKRRSSCATWTSADDEENIRKVLKSSTKMTLQKMIINPIEISDP